MKALSLCLCLLVSERERERVCMCMCVCRNVCVSGYVSVDVRESVRAYDHTVIILFVRVFIIYYFVRYLL